MNASATKDLVEIIGAVAAILVILGGVMLAILKNFFVTKGDCKEATDGCHKEVCKKIDTINNRMDNIEDERKKYSKINEKRNLWIVRSLTVIGEKVGANLDKFPDS